MSQRQYTRDYDTVRPVTRCCLFLDIQVVTHSCWNNSPYLHVEISTTHYQAKLIFSTIFVAHLHMYTCTIGCKKSLKL